MKKLILLGLVNLCFLQFNSQDEWLDDIVTEEFYSWTQASIDGLIEYPGGHVTYRTYAQLYSPSNYVSQIIGYPIDVNEPIIWGATNNQVWNSPDGGWIGGLVSEELEETQVLYRYDSFLTIGIVYQPTSLEYSEVMMTDNSAEGYGLQMVDPDVNNFSECVISTSFIGPNNFGIGPDLKVLLLQTTTLAEPLFRLNLLLADELTFTTQHYFWDTAAGLAKGLIYPVYNCDDPSACNYNEYEGYDTDNVTCDYSCVGCMDMEFCNFSYYAETDDGSCEGIIGCGDPTAINYSADAGCDDECLYDDCGQSTLINLCDLDNNSGDLLAFPGNDVVIEVISGELLADEFISFSYSGTAYQMFSGYIEPTDISGAAFEVLNDDFNNTNMSFSDDLASCILEELSPVVLKIYCADLLEGCTDNDFCNYNELALIDDGSCEGIIGCSDEDAANYDSDASCGIVSCIYAGCTNEFGLNFNPNATIENNSCVFGISGTIFYDTNQNEIKNDLEPGIENWLIEIPSLGLAAHSSDGGYFAFPNILPGDYEVVLTALDEWEGTTPISQMVSVEIENSSELEFGVYPSNEDYSFFNFQECCIFLPWIHCDLGFFPGVWFNNEGTAPLNGTISITWDPVLEAEPQFSSVTPDVLTEGYCEWQLEDYQPGSSDIFRIHILGPGVGFEGEVYNFNISFDFEDFNGEEMFSSGILLEPEVVCAYDPNDKYAEPEGYSEEHFILPDDRIQYRIRFQNTGNFPAAQVIVRDTLSPLLDFSTFDPIFASHNMNTVINTETGEVEFAFYNINLPDSINNEEESHGFLVFEIDPIEGLELGDVIENTGHIYFDGNPAIVTNTTWHTIYECVPEFGEFNLDAPMTCVGSEVFGSTDTDYIENYLWEINGAVQIDAENEMTYTLPASQEYEITFTATNPICEQTTSVSIEAFDSPSAGIIGDTEVCEEEELLLQGTGGGDYDWGVYGDSEIISVTGNNDETIVLIVTNEYGCTDETFLDLTVNENPNADFSMSTDNILEASDGVDFQWYLNGEEIDGANSQFYNLTEDGEYSVMVWNDEGCSDVSDTQSVIMISVSELSSQNAVLFPNPLTSSSVITFADLGERQVAIYTSNGKLVRDYGIVTENSLQIYRKDLSIGNYYITITNADQIQRIQLLILD